MQERVPIARVFLSERWLPAHRTTYASPVPFYSRPVLRILRRARVDALFKAQDLPEHGNVVPVDVDVRLLARDAELNIAQGDYVERVAGLGAGMDEGRRRAEEGWCSIGCL